MPSTPARGQHSPSRRGRLRDTWHVKRELLSSVPIRYRIKPQLLCIAPEVAPRVPAPSSSLFRPPLGDQLGPICLGPGLVQRVPCPGKAGFRTQPSNGSPASSLPIEPLTWAVQVFWHFLKRVQLTATKADALASFRCLPKGQLLAEALSDWPVQNNSTRHSLPLALFLCAAYPNLKFNYLPVDLHPHWKSTSIRETLSSPARS